MRRIRLDIEYTGTEFSGWQMQPGRRTVQGVLGDALEEVLGEPARPHGAGRTDAGAHARGQVAHFDTDARLAVAPLARALNRALPWDVRVMRAADVRPEFDARRSAVSKEYRYRVVTGEVMPPRAYPFAILVRGPLDAARLSAAASRLVGTHDFAAFRAVGSTARTTVRSVHLSEWREGGGGLVYRIAADGFLYKMVRMLVGTLLRVGLGTLEVDAISALLGEVARHDREPHGARGARRAGPAAPAKGLHLWRVRYGGLHAPERSRSAEQMRNAANERGEKSLKNIEKLIGREPGTVA